jgi:hypothetical protein
MLIKRKQRKLNPDLISLKPTKVRYTPSFRIVLSEEEKKLLKDLNNIMSQAQNVLLWNDYRRLCKKRFSMKLISIMDASGLISRTLAPWRFERIAIRA